MKLTKQELVEIIKEELDNILLEGEPVNISSRPYSAGQSKHLALQHAANFAGEEAAEKGAVRAMQAASPIIGRAASWAAGAAFAPMLAYDIGQYLEDRHKYNLETGKTEPTALDRVKTSRIRGDIARAGHTLDPEYAARGWAAARENSET